MVQEYLKEVPVSHVGSEIEKIRRASITNKKDPTVRATLANVIFVREPEDSSLDKIHILAKNLPSRFFVLTIDPKLSSTIRTYVGSHTVENASGQKIQTEEILITVSPDAINRVPNVILSQLVPDIDVILVDCESSEASEIYSNLLDLLFPLSNIYLMKSIDEASISQVREYNKNHGNQVSVRCWSIPLITKWCSLISEQFNSEYVLASLTHLHTIRIKCSVSTIEDAPLSLFHDTCINCVPVDVNLLLSWIEKSLKLKVVSYTRAKRDNIVVILEPTDATYVSAPVTVEIQLTEDGKSDFASQLRYIAFCMGNESFLYQVECSYLTSEDVYEISTGGTLESVEASQNICEFNVRRIPAQHICNTDAMLIAIRNQPIDCTVN